MKRVFLSGPISKGCLANNLRQFDAAAAELQREGLAVFNPGLSVYQGGVEAFHQAYKGPVVRATASAAGHQGFPHSHWVEMCKAWIAVSDAVLRLPGVSVGADEETAYATEKGVPVFVRVEDVVDHLIRLLRHEDSGPMPTPEVGKTRLGWEGGGKTNYVVGTKLKVVRPSGWYKAVVEEVWYGELKDLPARMLCGESYGSVVARGLQGVKLNYHVRRRTA